MIESTNFRTRLSTSLLHSTATTIAEPPDRLYPTSRNATMTGSTVYQSRSAQPTPNRQQWLQDRQPIERLEPNPYNWLTEGNPRLANLITKTIGDRWMTHLEDLQQLAPLAEDRQFQSRWRAIEQTNKQTLARSLERELGIRIDANTLFDLQLQPICGHQRQLLNLLYIISVVDRLKLDRHYNLPARTVIFSGDVIEPHITDEGLLESSDLDFPKGTLRERTIWETIESLSEIIAADPDLQGKLQIVYVPTALGLTNQLYAAADVCQQIATAIVEDIDARQLQAVANGVISIGSMGKTNQWLAQSVGAENCFRFGLSIPEVALFKEYGYDPYNYYKHYPQIRQAIDTLLTGDLTPHDPSLSRSIVNSLLGADEHMVLADYVFYAACQERVNRAYRQTSAWTQMSILNVAGVG